MAVEIRGGCGVGPYGRLLDRLSAPGLQISLRRRQLPLARAHGGDQAEVSLGKLCPSLQHCWLMGYASSAGGHILHRAPAEEAVIVAAQPTRAFSRHARIAMAVQHT